MSFEDIYQQYSEAVFQYIYFLVGQQTLAEDLMQETFLKAYHGMAQFKGEATYKTWLITIARNTTYDHFRKNKWVKLIPFLKEHEALDFTYAPESWLLSNEQSREFYEMLGQLKYEYREAIVLTKLEGFSVKQAAEILNWNEKKVENAVLRGIKKLGAQFGGEENAR
ncbi:RNA polymerase sigma factor [Metasolibacillus sp.]|uniref:RNA polymerase sigma factor n=1 Tax=Metasolibacillus sp. TaxID=2703680 RepID=UPI0025CCB8E5|nr:RNA polymerase sigma factor [Metasolibacillus sp.]MCT6924800.1 RNA polymerase sigma factor [Metasolibacillus sp.]MCT6941068.1 RNA polymerase sigma factor [Metasolibacillus sp.]